MRPPRKSKPPAVAPPEQPEPDDWSPLYGSAGMIFDLPEQVPDPMPAQPAVPQPLPAKPKQRARPTAKSKPKPPAPPPASKPAPSRAEAAEEFAYGPSGMVFDIPLAEPDAADVGAPAANLPKQAAGNSRPRRGFNIRKSSLVATRRLLVLAGLGALGLAATGVWRAILPEQPTLEPHWLVANLPDGQALVGRKRETGYGTVSVRIDVVSQKPNSEQWQFLVACPEGKVEYRSGDRWADKNREHPLGLEPFAPQWEAKAIAFACTGKVAGGPWQSYETALSQAFIRAPGSETLPMRR
jgi:hypothetical protein